MNPKAGDQYFRSAVLTATPEQLQLMLYDGAIRFATQAREAIEAKDIERTHNLLTRAQRIILEMQSGLRPEMAPGVCGHMASLYTFVYRRLVEANVNRDPAALEDAMQIMAHMRQTWVMLIARLQQERAGPAPALPRADPGPAPSGAQPAGVGTFTAEG
jgi:flagellar protein FliS